MRYTIKDLRTDFPSEDICLDYIFSNKYPNVSGYYRVTGRKCYAHKNTGHQIHPLAGTIFAKSATPLSIWFHVIFLFSTSKNGVSAKEIQRQTGVTYKTAWRMGHQIRKLMEQGTDLLKGTVEVDETYFGKRGENAEKFKVKAALIGVVERKGRIRIKKMANRRAETVLPFVKANVEKGSFVYSDEYAPYARLVDRPYGMMHTKVKHGKKHWTWGDTHTNTIEGFWGQLKRSIRGTYHFVSSQHLQAYVDEFAFRYNERLSSVPLFQTLVLRASR
jgi:transposase